MTKNASPCRRLFQLAAAISFAGCTPSTAPATSPDIYYLRSIDGRALPTASTSAPNANGVTILHEALIFDHAGTATRSREVAGPTPTTSQLSRVQYAYTLVDGVVTLGEQVCAPNAQCRVHLPEQGRVTDGMLSLATIGSAGVSSPVFRYQRFIGD